MLSFFINLLTLLRTVIHGIRKDVEFRTIIILLFFLLIGGTIFYWQVEGWSVLDSAYFGVMTISTVGYGDLAPTKMISKIFTIAFVILGIGLFASFVGKLVTLRLAHRSDRKERNQK